MSTPVRARPAVRTASARLRLRDLRRAVLVAAAIGLLPFSSTVAAQPCWSPPVDARVSDPFRSPPCRWCAGNRGIEYATRPGAAVRSVAAGTVSYSGTIAGVRYVVVEHANGWRTTYGGLARSGVRTGGAVAARSVVGIAASRLHFGLRVGAHYIDPARYLGEPTYRVRLIPIDGARSAPAGRPRLVCGR